MRLKAERLKKLETSKEILASSIKLPTTPDSNKPARVSKAIFSNDFKKVGIGKMKPDLTGCLTR